MVVNSRELTLTYVNKPLIKPSFFLLIFGKLVAWFTKFENIFQWLLNLTVKKRKKDKNEKVKARLLLSFLSLCASLYDKQHRSFY